MTQQQQQQQKTKTCPICLDDINTLIITSCGHHYCKSCITEWCGKNAIAKCPICRAVISTKNKTDKLNDNKMIKYITKKLQLKLSPYKILIKLLRKGYVEKNIDLIFSIQFNIILI